MILPGNDVVNRSLGSLGEVSGQQELAGDSEEEKLRVRPHPFLSYSLRLAVQLALAAAEAH